MASVPVAYYAPPPAPAAPSSGGGRGLAITGLVIALIALCLVIAALVLAVQKQPERTCIATYTVPPTSAAQETGYLLAKATLPDNATGILTANFVPTGTTLSVPPGTNLALGGTFDYWFNSSTKEINMAYAGTTNEYVDTAAKKTTGSVVVAFTTPCGS